MVKYPGLSKREVSFPCSPQSSRLLYLKGNLRAKTGTLSNVSSLAGYVSTQNGHKYVFAIIINDPKSSAKDKKLLEDEIIKTLYLKG